MSSGLVPPTHLHGVERPVHGETSQDEGDDYTPVAPPNVEINSDAAVEMPLLVNHVVWRIWGRMHQFIVDPPSCVAVSTKEGLHGVNAKGTGNADETLRSMLQVGMDMDLECDVNGPVMKGPREPKSIEAIRGRKSKWKRMARGAQLGSEGVTNGVNLGKHVVVSEPDTNGFVASASASLVWKGILWGRELLVKGLRWRVGDGSSISIYHDHWLHRFPNSKVMSPPELPLDSKPF
ncbi:hypothetical protein ACOSQ2_024206 [Xanthoceras sorbifolium]